MNKKSKVYIFLLLSIFSLQKIQPSPLLEQMPTLPSFDYSRISTFISSVSLQNVQKIISEHPKISLLVAVIFAFLSCKKLFFSGNRHNLDTNVPSRAEIHYSPEQDDATLLLTPHNRKEPYCSNHLHSYEVSPLGTYMLVRQINEISMRSALIKAFFGGLGFRSAIENLVRSCFIYHIIDIATGTILLSLENAQQCTFSPDGQFLLVREARQAGKITAFVASLLNDTKSLDNTKKISDIQYRLIHLSKKKTVQTFNNIFSVSFFKDQLLVVDADGGIQLKTYRSRCENNITQQELQSFIKTKFYFDNVVRTYCLDVEIPNKPVQTIQHIKTYTHHDNYLLIHTDPNEHKTLKALPVEFTVGTVIDTIRKVIAMGQKPQIDAQILDLSTGTFIDNKLFHYINLFVNSFTAQNTVFIVAFDDGSITYKEFNLHDFSTSIYQGGKAITFLDSNKYSVIDGCGLPCTPQRSSVVNAIHDFVADSTKGLQHNMQQTLDTVAENFEDIGKEINAGFQIFLAHITPDLEQSLGENLSDLPATNKEQTSYANFLFRCKKRSHHPKRKTDYQSLLRKEIHGFEWNIHIFDLGGFNSLEGYPFFPEGHICLSNLTPKDMNIFNYQSLKCELEKVIDYMKENKKVVISIFLAANNCAAETIDKEIAEVLQNKKYNPLLTCADLSGVQKTLDTITIEEMIQKNKRLLFFCDQENVKAAHPSTSVSKQIQYI